MATEANHRRERATGETTGQRTAGGDQRETGRWHRDAGWSSSFSPFAVMRQGLDEMERWFGGRGVQPPGTGRGMLSQMGRMAQTFGDWTPPIEAFQRGHEFVVRAEVPGMTRHDLTVEVGDDALTIRGERRHEQEEERDGLFWTERSYGSFSRVVPLPPGTIADSAKASFTNGILEVVMQAPSAETRRGRRIDIAGAPQERGAK
jgi:HSP20 family protein